MNLPLRRNIFVLKGWKYYSVYTYLFLHALFVVASMHNITHILYNFIEIFMKILISATNFNVIDKSIQEFS